MRIEINEYHKRRREAFPEKLSLLDEQTMRVSDSRYLLSPYSVLVQSTLYLFPSSGIPEMFTERDGAKVTERGVKYGPYKHVAPYNFDLI